MTPSPPRRPSIGRAGALPSFRLRTTSLNALRLRRIFDLFDCNGDGLLTPAELGLALRRLGLDADPADVDLTLAPYTKPGGGGLEFDDFEALHRELGDAIFGAVGVATEEEEQSDLSEAFKVFDEDGDGYISAAELQAVLGKLGLPEGREMEDVRKMICKVDENRDGLVDFLEFKHMMLQAVVPVRTA